MARNVTIFVIGALITLAVIFTVTLLLRTKTPAPAEITPPSADQRMAQLAQQAVDLVKTETGQALDFSTDSVAVVEARLKQLAPSINPTNPSPAAMETAIVYGAYAGEVMRRILGGHWEKDHPLGGPGSFPLITTNQIVLFPVAWCYDVLTGGEAASLYVKTLQSTAAAGSNDATNAVNDATKTD